MSARSGFRHGSPLAVLVAPGTTALLVVVAVSVLAVGAYGRGQRSAEVQTPASAFATTAGRDLAQFSGVVLDAADLPVPEVPVAMCASACWPAWTDATGRFAFENLPLERYTLDVRGDALADRTLTSVVFVVELEAGHQELPHPVRLADAVAVPRWDGIVPVSFAGLSLIPAGPVDLAALQRAAGGEPGGGTANIGGARIPPGAWPAYRLAVDEVPYRPLAMWALRPFGVNAGGPLAIQAPRPAIDTGAELAFFSVDLVAGTAQWLGPAIPDGEQVRTAAGSGIETLTWIILAARQG